VHYNLRLLSHYCEAAKNDKTYVTWDNNPKKANLENGAIVLEHLEAKYFGDHIQGADMPPPSTSKFPNVGAFPLDSHCPTLHGGHVVVGHVPRTLPPTPTHVHHRS
jgi:hypothetical protein